MQTHVLSLQQIAERFDGKVIGDPSYQIDSLASLSSAVANQLSFLANPKYQKQLKSTRAGAVLVDADTADLVKGNAVVVKQPYVVFAQLTHEFVIASSERSISAAAIIDKSARIGVNVDIAAGVVIGADVVIEDNCCIGANAVIGERSVVGEDSVIHPNVTLYADVAMGKRALIHSGVVIGSDGFGFAPVNGRWLKIAHLGGVRLGDDVEVGSNTTIDRGALDDTVIADGVKLDNQVLVAHNVEVGAGTAIAGCTAIAGSAKIGARCQIAGGVGITGHLTIADGTFISAMSLVSKSIKHSGSYSSGTGLDTTRSWRKNVVRFKKLDELNGRVKELEDKIRQIEGHS